MITHAKDRLVVVTASADVLRLERFADVLRLNAYNTPPVVAVLQKDQRPARVWRGIVARCNDYIGVVPAFAKGVELALMAYPHAEVIACLHDDCLVQEKDWDRKVLEHFDGHRACGLAGFGGAWGLGDEQAGQGEYRPTWLVRRGFMSNMQDAEVHGTRCTEARRIAVLDGFSLIFRAAFLARNRATGQRLYTGQTLFHTLQDWGVVHHAYDAAMGAFARQLGWETWLLPFTCQHLGGQTAVGDAQYAEWAKTQTVDARGDQRFWEEAHGIIWTKLGHLLPFDVDRPNG